uniref:Uncharacterized protein n=1 Tax=Hucho hucho TaxID=62062 RepID=A0A4W5PAT2_9TELE
MEPQGLLGAEGDCGMLGLLVPSPQSEAVTHELEELSLQPSNNLPPLNERKNVFGHIQTSKISGSHRPVTSSLRGSSVLHLLPVLMAPV